MCNLCNCKHHAIICAQCLDGYRQVKELMMELEAEAPLKGENDLVAESFQWTTVDWVCNDEHFTLW